MKPTTCTAALLLAGTFLLAGAAQDSPTPPKKVDAKKPVYDEKADAKAQLETALAAAKRENRRVLVQWGANWCGWCVLLHDRFQKDATLRKTLLYEYVVVNLDVGKLDKNQDLAAKYKANLGKGIPFLTVLDAEGRVLANQATDPFETKSEDGQKGHDPKKLQEFLVKHQAEPLIAEEVLKAALDKAAKTDRGVMLHFGAPWCGWCLRLEAWLNQPKIAEIMGKDFVEVKLDQDRMTGAKEVFARYRPKDNGGIPWFVFLDAKGKAVATSDGPKGNIGFPYEPHEITHFVGMLKASRQRLSDTDIETLRQSLTPPPKTAAAPR
jgi:thiol-disulfide isomerase/thioredoxin